MNSHPCFGYGSKLKNLREKENLTVDDVSCFTGVFS